MKQHLDKPAFTELVETYPSILQWCKDTIAKEIQAAFPERQFDVDYKYVEFFAWFSIGRMIEYLDEKDSMLLVGTFAQWHYERYIQKSDEQLCEWLIAAVTRVGKDGE